MWNEENKTTALYLAGIGMGSKASLTVEVEELLENCDCIVGAKRIIESLAAFKKPVFCAYKPEEILAFVKANPQYRRIVAALSGDVGFYSGAKLLREALKEYVAGTFPGISSVSYLAAKLGIAWEDAALVSAHGRTQNFIHTIAHSEKTFLLLGGEDCGRMLGEKLRYYGLSDVEITLGSRLSYEDEWIQKKRGGQLCEEDGAGLSAAFIYNPHADRSVCRHIEDEEFLRGKVPMTKSEVRALVLAKLHLTEDAVLYDVGAGTGSVAVEAACQSGTIKVYAVERNPEGIGLIHKNKQKFGCDWIEVIEGAAPDALVPLEAPTHVFIGGSGGRLRDILKLVKAKNPAVRIVITAISLETMGEVMEAVKEGLLLEPEMVQIQASHSKRLGDYHMMTAQNPVYLITE